MSSVNLNLPIITKEQVTLCKPYFDAKLVALTNKISRISDQIQTAKDDQAIADRSLTQYKATCLDKLSAYEKLKAELSDCEKKLAAERSALEKSYSELDTLDFTLSKYMADDSENGGNKWLNRERDGNLNRLGGFNLPVLQNVKKFIEQIEAIQPKQTEIQELPALKKKIEDTTTAIKKLEADYNAGQAKITELETKLNATNDALAKAEAENKEIEKLSKEKRIVETAKTALDALANKAEAQPLSKEEAEEAAKILSGATEGVITAKEKTLEGQHTAFEKSQAGNASGYKLYRNCEEMITKKEKELEDSEAAFNKTDDALLLARQEIDIKKTAIKTLELGLNNYIECQKVLEDSYDQTKDPRITTYNVKIREKMTACAEQVLVYKKLEAQKLTQGQESSEARSNLNYYCITLEGLEKKFKKEEVDQYFEKIKELEEKKARLVMEKTAVAAGIAALRQLAQPRMIVAPLPIPASDSDSVSTASADDRSPLNTPALKGRKQPVASEASSSADKAKTENRTFVSPRLDITDKANGHDAPNGHSVDGNGIRHSFRRKRKNGSGVEGSASLAVPNSTESTKSLGKESSEKNSLGSQSSSSPEMETSRKAKAAKGEKDIAVNANPSSDSSSSAASSSSSAPSVASTAKAAGSSIVETLEIQGPRKPHTSKFALTSLHHHIETINAHPTIKLTIKTIEDFLGEKTADEKKAILNSDEHGYTIIHTLMRLGEPEIILELLKKYEIDVAVSTPDGWNAVELLSYYFGMNVSKTVGDILDIFIEKGLSVNKPSAMPPLHIASSQGNVYAVDALIHTDEVDIYAKNGAGLLAVHYALNRDSIEAFNTLISRHDKNRNGKAYDEKMIAIVTSVEYKNLAKKLGAVKILKKIESLEARRGFWEVSPAFSAYTPRKAALKASTPKK